MAAVMEKAWTAPAGTRWSFPLFGGRLCFVRGTDEAGLEPSDELAEAIADVKAGRISRPYDSVDELMTDILGVGWDANQAQPAV